MLEIVAVLWASIAKELKEEVNKPAADLLKQTLEGQEVCMYVCMYVWTNVAVASSALPVSHM